MSIGLPQILVLDDDAEMLHQIAKAIAGHYRIISHTNPKYAIAALELESNIRVFVTEQVMRFGSGMDVLEAARSMKPHVRRVMITNYSDLASIIPGLHSGTIQALAQKPATVPELIAAIAPELLQQRTAQPRRLSA